MRRVYPKPSELEEEIIVEHYEDVSVSPPEK
jgi:hypothetical protein